MPNQEEKIEFNPFRESIHEIIFEADTALGRVFDIILLIAIILSVLTVMLESVEWINDRLHVLFVILEWIFTIFFTIEYALRLYCVYKPIKYATSFYGIIDLLAILPTYLSLLIYGTHYLVVIRALRILRVFRIFKLASFLNESSVIMNALKASRAKITVFLTFVLLVVIIIGSIMYLVEGGKGSSFTSIPRSIYWAIVTMTTVGYGDIHPITPVGQFIAAVVMIIGYAVIAVPTGIVSAEMVFSNNEVDDERYSTQSCKHCCEEGHETDAIYCKFCGEKLND